MSGAVGPERLEGVVVRWGGVYGYIQATKRSEWYFVHLADCGNIADLELGQQVTFTPAMTARGPRAVRVELVGAAAPERR